MKNFYRRVYDIIICISVESKVYNCDPIMIEALFRTYKSHPMSEIGNQVNYYIVFNDGKTVTRDYMYYSECNFENPSWRFRLMKELEIFYGKVLGSIVVHGSCVKYLGNNILLLGARMSGKTTLTHYLSIEKEGIYIDDDCVYINEKSAIGFSMPLPMRDSTNCKSKVSLIGKTLDTDGIDRTLFLPPRYLGSVSGISTIIIPSYNLHGKNKIRQVSKDEAFKVILSNIRSHNNMKALFNICKQLVHDSLSYELQYTSSENACILIEKELCNDANKK